ncbi:MAG: hypothetical protein J7L32_05285 [Thermoplasmata archaeon]|nr:hypothetical protein [Thermoplasmata archaeon]
MERRRGGVRLTTADYTVLIGLGLACATLAYFGNSLIISGVAVGSYAAVVYQVWRNTKEA